MIKLTVIVVNPFQKGDFKNLFNAHTNPVKHKVIEFEITRDTSMLAEAEFSVTTKTDHSGIRLNLGLLSYSVSLQLYDTRHWDNENNCWLTEQH